MFHFTALGAHALARATAYWEAAHADACNLSELLAAIVGGAQHV